jgi:hypothetical protein
LAWFSLFFRRVFWRGPCGSIAQIVKDDMKKKLLLPLCWALALAASAQIPANPIGANPLRLKWNRISTERVEVIFPRGLETQGQRVANLTHYMWDHNRHTIGELTAPVTIILQNQPVVSNGFVTVGPFRSEFFMTAPQFNYATDWVDILAIHEYRHVMQFANSRRGLTDLTRRLLGSWAWGGLMATALPRWYFEGDATGIETALTATGRGRLPSFDMEYRSLILNGIDYGYEKAGAGSLRDFVPSWYPLGYYLTTYARRHYGAEIWRDVVADAVRYRGLFFPFSHNLKKRTSLSTPALYRATYAELDSMWNAPAAMTNGDQAAPVPLKEKKTVIHYNHPHFLPDGRILAEKRGFDRIPHYVAIDERGKEEKITSPGAIFDPLSTTLSLNAGKLCWAELGFDQRWRNQNFSIIKIYDLQRGKKRKLSSRTRYFSPALSPGGERIVAVEASENLEYRLVVLDAQNGAPIQRLANPEGWFFAYPRWTSDGGAIVVVANKDEKSRLLLIDPAGGEPRVLAPPSAHQLSHVYPHGEYAFFSAAYTGINNIFAARLSDGAVFQLSDERLGAFQPSVDQAGEHLLFSAFEIDGYYIQKMRLDEALWRPIDPRTVVSSINYYQILEEQEGGGIIEQVPDEEFPAEKFNKLSGIINVHSLLPNVDHPIYGLQALSDNTFGTLSGSAGAFFNVNESQWTLLGNLSYAELFPVINAGFRRANRSNVFLNLAPLNDTVMVQTTYTDTWVENNVSGGLALPLNLSAGNVITRLNLRADYHYLAVNPANGFDLPGNRRDTFLVRGGVARLAPYFREPLGKGSLNAIDAGLNFQSFRRLALQNLAPRLGVALGVRYRGAFGLGALRGNVLLGRADVFLPGIGRNDGFFINTMYQRQEVLDNYRFADVFFYPRGYRSQIGDEYYKVGVNYILPLWYPDLALGPALFFKRVKGNFYYDHGRVSFREPYTGSRWLRSAGVDLTFDVRVFRLLDVDLGLRYSYLFDPARGPNGLRNQFNFLLLGISG